jgi:hypothetical protein
MPFSVGQARLTSTPVRLKHHHYLEDNQQQICLGQVQMEVREVLWARVALQLQGLLRLPLLIPYSVADLPGKQIFLEPSLQVKSPLSLV